jgi:nicotinamidase-related amidase
MNSTNIDKYQLDELVSRSDALLVIIDLQEKLMPVISGRDQVTENARRLLAFANIVGLPVIATEQEKLGPTLDTLARAIPDFKPVPKITFDCFGTEGFRDRVLATGRKTLILTGVEAHICVAQTALHALRDFRVQVIQDAVGSRTPENRDVAIGRMRAAGATVTSTEMFIYEILQRAGTDEFKVVLPLVK